MTSYEDLHHLDGQLSRLSQLPEAEDLAARAFQRPNADAASSGCGGPDASEVIAQVRDNVRVLMEATGAVLTSLTVPGVDDGLDFLSAAAGIKRLVDDFAAAPTAPIVRLSH